LVDAQYVVEIRLFLARFLADDFNDDDKLKE